MRLAVQRQGRGARRAPQSRNSVVTAGLALALLQQYRAMPAAAAAPAAAVGVSI